MALIKEMKENCTAKESQRVLMKSQLERGKARNMSFSQLSMKASTPLETRRELNGAPRTKLDSVMFDNVMTLCDMVT